MMENDQLQRYALQIELQMDANQVYQPRPCAMLVDIREAAIGNCRAYWKGSSLE